MEAGGLLLLRPRHIHDEKDSADEAPAVEAPVADTEMTDALELLAAMRSHVLNKGEQMVKYYGNYHNVSRGK